MPLCTVGLHNTKTAPIPYLCSKPVLCFLAPTKPALPRNAAGFAQHHGNAQPRRGQHPAQSSRMSLVLREQFSAHTLPP